MADKKITYQDCFYAEKYDKMGVTPFELYCRQNNLCWLELATDEIEGKEFFGDLYCTDGKEYALTKNILNPTFECAKCIVSFLEEVFQSGLAIQPHIPALVPYQKFLLALLTLAKKEYGIQWGD